MSVLGQESIPSGADRRTVRYWAALVALCALFLAVTNGPIFWIRLHEAPLTGALSDDVWVQATFVALTALVAAIAAPAARRLLTDRLVVATFGVFTAVMVASSLWSATTPDTVQQTTMFLLTTAAGLLAGAYLRRFGVLVALWLAMQVGVGVSLFAWWRDWEWVFSLYGGSDFTGIYLNANSMGPVALMGAASSVVLGLAVARRGALAFFFPILFGIAAVDGYVWWRTHSLTPVFAVLVAWVVVGLLALFAPGRARTARLAIGGFGAVTSVVVGVVALNSRAAINERLGRGSTLSGRRVIWDVVFDYIGERPIAGWGFAGAWKRTGIVQSLLDAGHPAVFTAHSGYLEVLLGVGVIGFVALLAVIAVVLARVGAVAWASPSIVSLWSLGLVVFALAANLTESFIGPNALPWLLLCVATGQSVKVRQRSAAAVGAPQVGVDPTPVIGADDVTPARGIPVFDVPIDAPFEAPLDFSFDERSDALADWRFDGVDPGGGASSDRRAPVRSFDGVDPGPLGGASSDRRAPVRSFDGVEPGPLGGASSESRAPVRSFDGVEPGPLDGVASAGRPVDDAVGWRFDDRPEAPTPRNPALVVPLDVGFESDAGVDANVDDRSHELGDFGDFGDTGDKSGAAR